MSEEILSKFEEEPPEGYNREGIIVPPDYYAVIEKKATIMGKETVKREIEKTENLPHGFIFSPDYTPRILIEDGKVVAIEILKKE
ncbi:MAG: hypothetical protein EU549_05340 [Promethearchaeota archaeon]|nr:MAG: hypothetical protein EU549_05340 [Candidatus Lokiarchaeota archaeon]